jgi:polyhydroxybutyrate depolymerase
MRIFLKICFLGAFSIFHSCSGNGGGSGDGGFDGGIDGQTNGDNDGAGGQDYSPTPPLVIGGDERPAKVVIPSDYDPTVPHPLLMVLHGFGPFTGEIQANYLGILGIVDEKDLVVLLPDGTENVDGNRFWNATDACCDPSNSVDDVGYLSGLIEEAKLTYNIDPNRVYLMGHSNGGFMCFRMACEASELITAIVSIAGSTFEDPADCKPATVPVSVLAVHGTADDNIEYEGGTSSSGGNFPGAVETVERFASRAGCDSNSPTDEGTADLVSNIEGAETDMVAYSTGCEEGIDAGLWTINGGGHIPMFTADFADMTTDWLLGHSR